MQGQAWRFSMHACRSLRVLFASRAVSAVKSERHRCLRNRIKCLHEVTRLLDKLLLRKSDEGRCCCRSM